MPYKIFVNGFPLNASELNTFVMPQTISTFVDAAAREAAIENPVEGQFSYLTGSNQLTAYDGSAWQNRNFAEGSSTVSDKTANYSTLASDAGNTINSTGSAITVTIDNNLTASQRIDFVQTGSGQITFAAGSGVTLNSKDGKLKTAGQFSAASVLCLASGSYILVGDLGA